MKLIRQKHLQHLFYVALFPSHMWMMYRALIRAEFVFKQRGGWGTLGFVAYQIEYALLDSILVFVVLLLMLFIIPTAWDNDRRISVIVAAYFMVSFWAILRWQYFFLSEDNRAMVIEFFHRAPGPISIYPIIFRVLIALFAGWGIWGVAFDEKKQKFVQEIIGNLKYLGWFYLGLDLAGVVVIVIRNLP